MKCRCHAEVIVAALQQAYLLPELRSGGGRGALESLFIFRTLHTGTPGRILLGTQGGMVHSSITRVVAQRSGFATWNLGCQDFGGRRATPSVGGPICASHAATAPTLSCASREVLLWDHLVGPERRHHGLLHPSYGPCDYIHQNLSASPGDNSADLGARINDIPAACCFAGRFQRRWKQFRSNCPYSPYALGRVPDSAKSTCFSGPARANQKHAHRPDDFFEQRPGSS